LRSVTVRKETPIRGFVLRIVNVKNEDVVATVLSRQNIGRYYRFYGARHSILQMGYLVDFETEEDNGIFLPRMRSLSHFSFPWIFDTARLMVWQQLLGQLEKHLRDTDEVEAFYYDTLLESAKKWHRQNPKRLAVEAYTRILAFEGRLHTEPICYVCERPVERDVALMASFKPAHPHCIYAPALSRRGIKHLFAQHKTTLLSDAETDALFALLLKAF